MNAKKSSPQPERLVIESDTGEALDKLLGKGKIPGPWHDYADGLPDFRRAHERPRMKKGDDSASDRERSNWR